MGRGLEVHFGPVFGVLVAPEGLRSRFPTANGHKFTQMGDQAGNFSRKTGNTGNHEGKRIFGVWGALEILKRPIFSRKSGNLYENRRRTGLSSCFPVVSCFPAKSGLGALEGLKRPILTPNGREWTQMGDQARKFSRKTGKGGMNTGGERDFILFSRLVVGFVGRTGAIRLLA